MAKKRDPVSEYLAKIGRRGGEARVAKGTAVLTEEQRKERARHAAAARWGAEKAKKTTKSA